MNIFKKIELVNESGKEIKDVLSIVEFKGGLVILTKDAVYSDVEDIFKIKSNNK